MGASSRVWRDLRRARLVSTPSRRCLSTAAPRDAVAAIIDRQERNVGIRRRLAAGEPPAEALFGQTA